ncbi:MAG: diguanylate cyclase [Sulfurovum sp.]|nr:diguanylate cyclase [Sulfurovum sp.]
MKKHSIHDHDTALFNKKFFLAELHATFERADRNEYPLSMLSASFSADALNNVDKKTKKTFLKNLGKVFTSVTRGSDIVCRYDKNHIVVLLPLTEGEEALILEGRLQKALENEDLGTTSKVAFDLKSFQADWDENEASFVEKIG